MRDSPFDDTTRLANRVFDGEVIFFVGSGFSIDSERNDASRLVGRLLAGILAMGTILAEERGNERSQARAVLDRLGRVFDLAGAERQGDAARQPARWMTKDNLKVLAREYYNFNDSAVSALGVLSRELLDLDEGEARSIHVASRVQQLATFLLGLVGDPTPLDAIDCRALREFRSDAARGKALFLDMMGFANQAIMTGTPDEADLERVALSYQGRLRPRHHALARLAREGLAAAMVTTNYDLLLEGAYRLAGFVERRNTDPAPDGMPADVVPRFSRIAGADQFFARGQGYRTALLLKIHGCAQAYRDVRSQQIQTVADNTRDGKKRRRSNVWADYLPALVFTYREIQTWRADAWSRDLIRTLLRTHTIALCGYSGADPVMHATFREVYEEKTLSRSVAKQPKRSAADASVFFFGRVGRREFHSLEILRAATIAAGYRCGKLLDHPNHIEFEPAHGFPTLDDHFRWLTHVVLRGVQAEVLATGLRRLAPRVLRRQCRDQEVRDIRERFAELCKRERAVAAELCSKAPKDTAAARNADAGALIAELSRRFDEIVGWTWHFLPGFLRELALAEMIESHQGGHAFRAKRTWAYYHPAKEHPEWSAWSVVVELALRSLVAKLPVEEPSDASRLVPEDSPYPAISFGGVQAPPKALCIRVSGFERPGRDPALIGAFRKVTYWNLETPDVPWPIRPTCPCPRPAAMLRWALGRTSPTHKQAKWHLEGER